MGQLTVKEYLNQANNIERRIRILKREIEKMRELSTSVSVKCDGDRVQKSSAYDPLAVTVTNIIEREEMLSGLIKQYIEKKEILESQISMMNNRFYSDVLYGKYVAGLSFNDLSLQIGRDRRHTIRIHNKAISEFEEQFFEIFSES